MSSIEMDSKGGRVVLPWSVQAGEYILISLRNELSHYKTVRARIAWKQDVQFSGTVVAGLAFDEEVCLAA